MIIIIEGPEGGGSCGCAFSCMLTDGLALRVYRVIIIIIIIIIITKTNTTSSVEGTNRYSNSLMSTDMSEVSG
jgi:hypothetical protein